MTRFICGALFYLIFNTLAFSGENATFVLKSGEVLFGTFEKMTDGQISLSITDENGVKADKLYNKDEMTEVIFDSGEKLDLALSDWPQPKKPVSKNTASAASTTPQAEPHVQPPQDASPSVMPGYASPGPPPYQQANAVDPDDMRNPFTYGGASALVPGLGQMLQENYLKGGLSFALVTGAAAGAITAWILTTEDYTDWSNTGKDAFFKDYMLKKRGAQFLTFMAAALYLINIGDAAFDAHLFNKALLSGNGKYGLEIPRDKPGLKLTMKF